MTSDRPEMTEPASAGQDDATGPAPGQRGDVLTAAELSEAAQSATGARRRRSPGLGAKPFLARMTILWERAAPLALVAAAPSLILLFLSLTGAWTWTPAIVHWGAICLAAAATAGLGRWAIARGPRRLWPSSWDALYRLERDGAVRHDAVQLLGDRPFVAATPTAAPNALWVEHEKRMRTEALKARLIPAAPDFDAYDPLGLRYALPALLAIGLVAADDDWLTRLGQTFSPTDPALRQAGLIDMWIEPPAYVGRPPSYLMGPADEFAGERAPIETPVGSRLVVQIPRGTASGAGIRVEALFADGTVSIPEAVVDKPVRQEIVISDDAVVRVRAGALVGRWPIVASADAPPAVYLTAPPAIVENGGLRLLAHVSDDYGVAGAALEMRVAADPAPHPDSVRPERKETKSVELNGLLGASGPRELELDLLADPWAGLSVEGRLVVIDGAGQRGESEPFRLGLPQRAFANPLARAVVEQRQTLSIAPNQWRRAELAFNGLTIGPERFYDRAAEYLLMRTALWRVAGDGEGPKDIDDTVDALWPLALQLEDQDIADARAALEAAEAALRDALARGADAPEIARLTEALRQAMQAYLQALAQSPAAAQGAPDAGGETMEMSDLDKLLDAVRNLGQSGATNAAQQALDQLRDILDNLQMSGASGAQGQSGQSGQGGQGGQGGAGQAADLIGRQRDLADETFGRRRQLGGAPAEAGGRADPFDPGQFGQNPFAQNPYGPTPLRPGLNGPSTDENSGGGARGLGAGEPDAAGDGGAFDPQSDLAAAQKALAEDLRALLAGLDQQVPPNSRPDGDAAAAAQAAARAALESALEEMRGSEEALQSGGLDAAVSAMGRAIDQLREGAAAIADAREQQDGEGENGQGQARGGQGQFDPLGRPVGDAYGDGTSVDVPGVDDARRSRELLEKIWERLSTGDLTEEEVRYLERLLERF